MVSSVASPAQRYEIGHRVVGLGLTATISVLVVDDQLFCAAALCAFVPISREHGGAHTREVPFFTREPRPALNVGPVLLPPSFFGSGNPVRILGPVLG